MNDQQMSIGIRQSINGLLTHGATKYQTVVLMNTQATNGSLDREK